MNIVFWLIVLIALIIFWFCIRVIFIPLGGLILSMVNYIIDMIRDFKKSNKNEEEDDYDMF